MEILQLVDQLEQVIARGRKMPLSSSVVVDAKECLRLIDQMRISVPSAIKESERMIGERDRILSEARRRADGVLAQAEQNSREMVSKNSVAEAAAREADRIIDAAEEQAEKMMEDAEVYTLDVLSTLSAQLERSLRQARNGIEAIEASRSPQAERMDDHSPADEASGSTARRAPVNRSEPRTKLEVEVDMAGEDTADQDNGPQPGVPMMGNRPFERRSPDGRSQPDRSFGDGEFDDPTFDDADVAQPKRESGRGRRPAAS